MGFSYVPLPSFRAPEPLDFRGLNEGLDVMRENMRRNKLLEEAKAVGAATYGGAPDGNVSPQPAPMQPNRLLSSSSPAQYQGGGVVDRIIGAESGGRANATNPRSSATGAGQFISSTWLDTIKRARPDLASGKSDADLLAMRNDGNLSREMTAAYADQNGKALQSAGFDATPGNTYLAHFAGPAGARSVLSADPATPLTRILSPDAIRANPHIANMTAGDLRSWAERKMGGGQAQQAPARQASGPNYDAGIRLAYSQGNTALAMQLQQQKQEAENTSYTRQRQSVQDAQAAESHGLNVQEAQDKLQKNFVTTVGAAAQIIANEQDPAKKAAMWQTMVSSDPRFARSLQRYGVDPSDVNAGTKMLIAEAQGMTGKKYEFTKYGVGDPSTGEIRPYPAGSQAANADDELGLAPVYYEDKVTKEPRIGQMSKTGGPLRPVETPGRVLPQLSFQNTGTAITGMNTRTGAEASTTPINIVGRETAEKVGQGLGERQVNQPVAQAGVISSSSGLDRLAAAALELKNAPGTESMTGVIQGSGLVPNVYTATADAQAKLTTLKSQIAFSVLQAMKDASKTGGALGAVSEKELSLLENNLASLELRQGDAAFKGNLDKIITYAAEAKQRLKDAYDATYGNSASQQSGPQVGAVEDGHRFKGGNPADPNSWEKVN